jgi:hypothetical protein
MSNTGNRALEIRILDLEFGLSVEILTRNYPSGKKRYEI